MAAKNQATKQRAQVPKQKVRSLYSVHPGIAMVQDWIATLKHKTGRTPAERSSSGSRWPRPKGCTKWLESEHGFGTNTAAWLAERAAGGRAEEDTPEGYLAQAKQYVEQMYAGERGMKPRVRRSTPESSNAWTLTMPLPTRSIAA